MITQAEITEAIKDARWQRVRLSMKGMSTEQKVACLAQWLIREGFTRQAEVQVENYANALRRGGLLPKTLR